MHKFIGLVMIAVVLLLGSLAYGQDLYGGNYDASAYQAARARLGWYDCGDLGGGLGVGADYMWKNTLASFDWASTSRSGDRFNIMALSLSYLWRQAQKPGTYVGAGVGWYDVDAEYGDGDGSMGWHLVLGTEFGKPDEFGEPAWFAQASYVLDTEVFDHYSIDGIRLAAGRRF